MQDFRLPDPGEGLTEADIVEWKVSAGDQVKVNDIVVEVETSKSLVELPIPYAGTVSQVLAQPGDTVEVGTPIVRIDDGTGSAESAAEPAEAGSAENPRDQQDTTGSGGDQEDEQVPTLVGYGPRASSTKRRPRKRTTSAERAREAVSDAFGTHQPVGHRHGEPGPLEPAGHESSGGALPEPGNPPPEPDPAGGPVLAKPPVRKLAKDLGVDLAGVTATGRGGVITREDVLSASSGARDTGHPSTPQSPEPGGERPEPGSQRPEPGAQRPEPGPQRPEPGPQRPEPGPQRPEPGPQRPEPGPQRPEPVEGQTAHDIREPIKGVRKATAQAMVSSAFTAPHVTEWVTCDVSASMELLDRLRQRREFAQVKVSPLLLAAKAALLALGRTRELNASWDDDAGEIVYHGAVNLGIATATQRGLMVPNIKDAQRMTLVELAQGMQETITTAREGKAQPADLSGGTFSITNVGIFGVDGGTPILNPGESGILAIGGIDRKPWVVGSGPEERIEPRWVTTLAVSFDHRIVDGEQGSRFLSDIAGILTDPATSLLY